MRLEGRVVLISGASRGVGAELARQAVAKGALVALIARTTSDLEALRSELGDACVIATADVSSYDEVVTAVGKLTAELGRVDVLVNNAGIGLYGAFLDAEVADVERLMRVNYLGVVHLLKAVLPGMVERRRGHVVTIGSIAGRIGTPFEAAYSATKFAVAGLTEALSVELAPFGIDATLISPGPIDTPFFEARGHAYERAHPKPVPAARVAARVLSAVEGRRSEAFISPLLRQAVIAKTLVPPLFRWGTARTFAEELKTESAR